MTSRHITFTKAEIRAIVGSLTITRTRLPLDEDTRELVDNLINKLRETVE